MEIIKGSDRELTGMTKFSNLSPKSYEEAYKSLDKIKSKAYSMT